MRYVPFLLAAGAAIYLVIWLLQSRSRRGGSRAGGAAPHGPARGPRRPVAPDDDPEFLAELDRRRREAQGPSTPEAADEPDASADPTTPTDPTPRPPEHPAEPGDPGRDGPVSSS